MANDTSRRLLPGLVQAIQEVSIVQSGHHTQTSTALEDIVSMLEASSRTDTFSSSSLATCVPTIEEISEKEYRDIPPTSSLCVKVALPSQRCDALCACQCHIKYQTRTPKWLHSTIGTLFYNSVATPAIGVRPCSFGGCKRSPPFSSSKLTYYFPSWAVRMAISWSSWNDLTDGSRCMIEMPREVSPNSPCWTAIKLGNVEVIRSLLSERLMSPYDIDQNGWSVLHVSRV
jgi:hypothetical protein